MARPEIEGDWVMGWPDRKRAGISAGKDSQGRVINGRSPVTMLEGLLTPTDAYYIVNQLEVPEPIHPDDWVLQVSGLVEKPIAHQPAGYECACGDAREKRRAEQRGNQQRIHYDLCSECG